ncbi:MAG: proteasome accessory factor PafA2 family protein [Nitrospiria bacterium]
MLDRIVGIETEYGLLVHSDERARAPERIAHRLRDFIFREQHLGLLDQHHRDYDEPIGNGGFLLNAGRLYVDMGHLEYASPECSTLADIVAYDRAGDAIVQRALDEAGLGEQASLIKNNIDHETGATFGSHENYLVRRSFPFDRGGLDRLVPFLVTRQIFTGSGRVGAAHIPGGLVTIGSPPTRDPVTFQISQRADHIVNEFFQWVQANRSIINTRDEPLADPDRFRRIHLLLGDSNLCEVATALKVGTTSLVLQLIEDGARLDGWTLMDPVGALRSISRDPSRRWMVELADGRTMSAVTIQEGYAREARERYYGQDDETDWVIDQWERVLTDLQGDYRQLVGRVDWASKLWLLETFREAEGVEWGDPWLKSLDLEYHNLQPSKGLYFALGDEGRLDRYVTDEAVELAVAGPPRNTRAFGRGEAIRHLMGTKSRYVITWSGLLVEGRQPFRMPDPFVTYAVAVAAHLDHGAAPGTAAS